MKGRQMTIDQRVFDLKVLVLEHTSGNPDIDASRLMELADIIQGPINRFLSELDKRNTELKYARSLLPHH